MSLKSLQQENKEPTHAGGVVLREKNGRIEFLLVSAKNFSFIWVLPKGHIESSETEQEAAVREVKEESGMTVSVIGKIGNSERLKWNFKKQVTAFYLMKFEAFQSQNEENRKVIWLALNAATRKLFYSDQKKIMKQLRMSR